jgi:DNA-binding response OmpR family regulator
MTKILIGEDESFIASLYKLELERHGVQVTIAANGQEVLDAMEKETFDVLLLDLIMPGVDGFEVLERLQARKSQVPVLVLTNLSQAVDQNKCRELGAKDYIVKVDIDAPDVWKKIQKWVPSPTPDPPREA